MKKTSIIIVALFFIAGCGEMTYEDRLIWSQALRDSAQLQQQNLNTQWQYSQPQIVYPRQQQNNSTYWQEKYYQKKVLDSNLVKTPSVKFRVIKPPY